MGLTMSEEDQASIEKSRQIDKDLKEYGQQAAKEIKLLLLGADESGKSTIMKQIKIIHGSGFTAEDYEQYKGLIYNNVIHLMVNILQAMIALNIPFENIDRQADQKLTLDVITHIEDAEQFSGDILEALKRLWADSGVQQCFGRANEYHLNDSAKYFLDDLDRLGQPDYQPTEQDILRTRRKTTGIMEEHCTFKGLSFKFLHMAGQQSVKSKWFHCFDDVTAIVFCVAISEYDQIIQLDNDKTNRLHQSLKLFQSICKNKWFTKTSIILLLNKTDLFEEKIKTSPLTVCFPDYSGGQDYQEALAYIQGQFSTKNGSSDRTIYYHTICAVDTAHMRLSVDVLFDAAIDIIIAANLVQKKKWSRDPENLAQRQRRTLLDRIRRTPV